MKRGKRSIHVLMVAVMLGIALAVALPAAHAAHLTIDDTVEAQITLTHDAWWEFGVNSNATVFAGYVAGSTTNPGEVVTFTGSWYVNAPGNPDPGQGIIYVVEPDNPNLVSDIINAQWSTQPGGPYYGKATITINVTSSPCHMNLGPLPAAFAGMGVVETGKLFGITGLFRDPSTAALVTIPSNLGILFGSAICIDIDIKPGSDPNCFNNDGHGTIPVAILSDYGGGFDATQVDPNTVSLSGLDIKMVGKSDKLLAHIEDVNDDGWDDLVVQIQDEDNVFEVGDSEAILTGELYDGTTINGVDSICIVP